MSVFGFKKKNVGWVKRRFEEREVRFFVFVGGRKKSKKIVSYTFIYTKKKKKNQIKIYCIRVVI